MLSPCAPLLGGDVAVRGGQSPLVRGGVLEHEERTDGPSAKHDRRVPPPVGRVAVPAVEERRCSPFFFFAGSSCGVGGGGVGTAPPAPAGHYPQGLLHRLTPLHLPNPTRDRSNIAAYQPPAGVQTHLGYGICGPAPMTTSTCSRV